MSDNIVSTKLYMISLSRPFALRKINPDSLKLMARGWTCNHGNRFGIIQQEDPYCRKIKCCRIFKSNFDEFRIKELSVDSIICMMLGLQHLW